MSSLAPPLRLPCGVDLPNRIAKSAMSENMADPGHVPGDRLVRLYERWGRSGAGLLLSGNVMVDGRALGEPNNVVVEDDRALDALRRWSDAAQAGGARFWWQINHVGRQSPRSLSAQPVAPSAVPMAIPGKVFA
ncbi:MAG: hypothetical protein ACK4YP_12720, partial [Myxococcota bacterium]